MERTQRAQACYDGDILPEEVIIAWGKKPSKKYLDKETAAAVRKHAQPILDWLEYALPSLPPCLAPQRRAGSNPVARGAVGPGWRASGRTAEEESDDDDDE